MDLWTPSSYIEQKNKRQKDIEKVYKDSQMYMLFTADPESTLE